MRKTCISILILSVFCIAWSCANRKTEAVKILVIERGKAFPISIDSGLALPPIQSAIQSAYSGMLYFFNNETGIIFRLHPETGIMEEFLHSNIVNGDDFAINDSLGLYGVLAEDTLHVFNSEKIQFMKKALPMHEHFYLFTNSGFSFLIKSANEFTFFLFPNLAGSMNDSVFFTYPLEGVWNTDRNEVSVMNVHYPDFYKKNMVGLQFMPFRTEWRNGSYLYSFPYSDSVFLYKSNYSSSHFLGSRTEKQFQFIPFSKQSEYDASVVRNLYAENPSYYRLKVLPKHRLIYRAFFPKKEQDNTKIKEWILVFYDDRFNYLGETNLIDYGLNLIETDEKIYDLKRKNDSIICTEISLPFL